MKEIKRLYETAKSLREEAQAAEDLLGSVLGKKIKNKPSLVTVAANMGSLAYRFNNLRVEIIKVHERK